MGPWSFFGSRFRNYFGSRFGVDFWVPNSKTGPPGSEHRLRACVCRRSHPKTTPTPQRELPNGSTWALGLGLPNRPQIGAVRRSNIGVRVVDPSRKRLGAVLGAPRGETKPREETTWRGRDRGGAHGGGVGGGFPPSLKRGKRKEHLDERTLLPPQRRVGGFSSNRSSLALWAWFLNVSTQTSRSF